MTEYRPYSFREGEEFDEATDLAERVRGARGDSEIAHQLEDELMRRVLECIRDGFKHPAELANIGICTLDLDFPRWFA